LPTAGDLEVYRLVFELFDREFSGYITEEDTNLIAIKLGFDPEQGKTSFFIDFKDFSFTTYPVELGFESLIR
jgi:hypothetical protein